MSPLPPGELALLPLLELVLTLFCCELTAEVLSSEGPCQMKKIATASSSVRMMATMRVGCFFGVGCTGAMDASIYGSSELLGVCDTVTNGTVTLICGRVCCCESWYCTCTCDAAGPGLRNCGFGSIVQSPPT